MRSSEMKRQAIVDKLRHTAKRLERTNKVVGIVKIIGGATGIAGGLTSACIAFLSAAGLICPLIGVIILGAGSITIKAGSTICGVAQVTKVVKNRRRKDVLRALSNYRDYMGRMLQELRPYIEEGPANVTFETWTRMNLLHCLYSLGALGVSMAPQQLEAKAQLMDVILRHESPLSLHELPHNKVLETLYMWKVPGISTVLDETGISVVGADSLLEAVGEMVFDNVVPIAVLFSAGAYRFFGDGVAEISSQRLHAGC